MLADLNVSDRWCVAVNTCTSLFLKRRVMILFPQGIIQSTTTVYKCDSPFPGPTWSATKTSHRPHIGNLTAWSLFWWVNMWHMSRTDLARTQSISHLGFWVGQRTSEQQDVWLCRKKRKAYNMWVEISQALQLGCFDCLQLDSTNSCYTRSEWKVRLALHLSPICLSPNLLEILATKQ